MRLKGKIAILLVTQAILQTAFVATFAYRSFARGLNHSEALDRAATDGVSADGVSAAISVAVDEGEATERRLEAALSAITELNELRSIAAAGRFFRAQAAVDAATRLGLVALAGTLVSALAFILLSGPMTRGLDILREGTRRVGTDRGFRFGPERDPELRRTFQAFDSMLDTIDAQESRLEEVAKLAGWREVASFLFHQLRAPLAAISMAARNHAEAAECALGGNEETLASTLEYCCRRIDTIQEESVRAIALMNRFRALSALSVGVAETFDLRTALASASARVGNIQVLPQGLPAKILGDRPLVEEAFFNILSNAAEACATPPGRVIVGVGQRNGRVTVTFQDENGPCTPGIVDRLGTERFTTKREGTGFGLLFVRRVAALHGGKLAFFAAESGLGVSLDLPGIEG